MRDWPAFIEEMVRILRPGGLLVSVDSCLPFLVLDGVDGPMSRVAPGFAAYHDILQA